MCHRGRMCFMSADRWLIGASLSLKQTFHLHNGSLQPLVHTDTPTDKLQKPIYVCKIRQRQTCFCSHNAYTVFSYECNKQTTMRTNVFSLSFGVWRWRCERWGEGAFALQAEERANSVYCPQWVKWFLTTPKWSPGGRGAAAITDLLYDCLCVWESWRLS